MNARAALMNARPILHRNVKKIAMIARDPRSRPYLIAASSIASGCECLSLFQSEELVR